MSTELLPILEQLISSSAGETILRDIGRFALTEEDIDFLISDAQRRCLGTGSDDHIQSWWGQEREQARKSGIKPYLYFYYLAESLIKNDRSVLDLYRFLDHQTQGSFNLDEYSVFMSKQVERNIWPITDSRTWPENDIVEALDELQEFLLSGASENATKWWLAFREENTHRLNLVYRLAEEIRNRNCSIQMFFNAYVHSNTDNIQGNLSYLDYQQLKTHEAYVRERKRAIESGQVVEPERPAPALPPSTSVCSNTAGWSISQVHQKLSEVLVSLGWEDTTGSAKKWWEAFTEENKHRYPLVLRLAEELAYRRATITEFFLSYVYSNTDNIQANLCYMEYSRLKKEEERKRREAFEEAERELDAQHEVVVVSHVERLGITLEHPAIKEMLKLPRDEQADILKRTNEIEELVELRDIVADREYWAKTFRNEAAYLQGDREMAATIAGLTPLEAAICDVIVDAQVATLPAETRERMAFRILSGSATSKLVKSITKMGRRKAFGNWKKAVRLMIGNASKSTRQKEENAPLTSPVTYVGMPYADLRELWIQAKEAPLPIKLNGDRIIDSKYEPQRILGRSNRALVLDCIDNEDGEHLALKILFAPQGSVSEAVRREALSIVSCHNTNVVELDDFCSAGGINYLVMSLYETDLMREEVSDARIPRLVRQILEGVGYMHRVGILHRNLSPDNILISRSDDSLRIGGFGSAVLPGDDPHWAMSTPSRRFMAPEVKDGGQANVRSDLYSVGAVWYWLTTGEWVPTGHGDNARLRRRLERAGLAPGVSDVLAKLLAKDPDQRFGSCKEVVDAIGPWGEPRE